MAAKLLHSLSDDNIELQKQIGCMNGIFQLFDRHHILTGGAGRRVVAHTHKRPSDFNGDSSMEREYSSAQLRSASVEKYSHKNLQEKQRISTESSRASFSSSRSSSFSSIDCSRATQLEPESFDRIIFPETPSRDSSMSLQSLSPQFSRQSRDLRDLVKDSMNREIQGSSVKPKAPEKRDSSRARPEITNNKLQEAPWYQNEPRTLLRSTSYHSNGSSFPISRDAPRFSYDGREANRFDSRDVSKSSLKLKDLPRLSLDSKAGSMRSLHADSKSNFFLTSNSGESDDNVRNVQGHQTRPPSVVAKLMGLETLPDSVSSTDKDIANISRSFAERGPSPIQLSGSSKNTRKEPSSPSWRNPDSSMKPMARFPIEPAPWKQIEGRRSSPKPTKRVPAKGESTLPSVYSEIEKRLTDLEFTQSGKDLRALKQILEAMQSKGYLQSEKEVPGSSFVHDQKHFGSKHEARSVDHQKPQSEHVLASTKRRTRHMESPIVIMKPAKLVEKSVISLDGLSGVPTLQDDEFLDHRKSLRSGRIPKDMGSKSSQRDNAVNSANMKIDRTQRTTQTSMRPPQNLVKDGSGKSSGSISPRLQQKKLELDKRSRPPTPPDSTKSRRQSSKQQGESNSPGGRRRPKHAMVHESGNKLSEVNVESRNSNSHENENSVQSKASEFMSSGFVEKNSTMSEEESPDYGIVCLEYSSPVSVLDNIIHKDDSPSPVKYTQNTIKVDVSMDKERDSGAVHGNSADIYLRNSQESCSSSQMNHKKLQNIENLVQKLRRLNSNHDEARTDYIASLCENTDPDHRYISEILLASGLLLRDLGSSLANFQFHPSGHPINPELFLVLEQTKASTLLDEESSPEKKTQLTTKAKFHRKLIFDTVNEILSQKLASPGPFSEPWSRPLKRARRALNAQKLLRELCYEIEALQAKNAACSSNEETERWKVILCKDVMHESSESWIDFNDEISGAVLDIERSIFKDLVNEIVIGESKTKTAGRRRLFAK